MNWKLYNPSILTLKFQFMKCFEFCIKQFVTFWKFKCIRLRTQRLIKSQLLRQNFTTHQFLNETFVTCPALKNKVYNVSHFEFKTSKRARYWKRLHTKVRWWIMLLPENGMFCIFSAFSQSMILKRKFEIVWFFELKKSRAVLFDVEN